MIKQLKEKRGDLLKANQTFLDKAKSEERMLTDAELADFEKNKAEIEKIDATLEADATQNRQMRRVVGLGKGEDGEKLKVVREFRFTKAFKEAMDGNVTGLEAELLQEARQEAQLMNIPLTGKFQLPAFFSQKKENRAITVGGNGGNLVATDLEGLIGILRPQLTLEQMGCTVITGLVGNIDFPEQTAKSTGSWLAETASASESNPDYGKRSAAPHRLASYAVFSRQQLIQASMDMEMEIREDLRKGISENVEYAIINGSGTDPVPYGLLNISGIGNVEMGTNGGVPTYGKVIDLQTTVATANYHSTNNLNYLTTPQMRGLLKQTQKFSGTNGMPIWDGKECDGFGGFTSTLVPSNLTKGTAENVCHAILFGDFSQVKLLQWGGYDFIFDEVTLASDGKVKITINTFWDVFLKYKAAIAAIKDAKLS